MAWSLQFSDYVPRVAVLASKLHHCMYDILARWRLGELHAEIPLVVSNHDDARSIVADFDVAFEHYAGDRGDEAPQEQRIVEALERERIDLVVLARYMQVLSDGFVRRYPDRIINIHHSFLPAFVGAQAVPPGARARREDHRRDRALRDAGAGPGADHRPGRRADEPSRSVDDLVRKGRDLERAVLARAVDLHLRNRVVVYGNKTVVFD